MRKRILTGITTTGTPHIGNYLGAIKPALELVASDKSTERDVDKFCEFLGHGLVKKEITKESLYFVVQKKDKNII